MKRFLLFSLILFSSFAFLACQRDGGVQAGNESATYQPRPAPSTATDDAKRDKDEDREMSGELVRVDIAAKTVVIRLDNGLMQTFKFNDDTSVDGLEKQPKSAKGVRGLAGKEGSDVTIQWAEDNGPKLATEIEVTRVNTSKNTRRQ